MKKGPVTRAFSWWAVEDLNLRPLPCQGCRSQASDQHVCWSSHVSHVAGVPPSPVGFGRLLDRRLTGSATVSIVPGHRSRFPAKPSPDIDCGNPSDPLCSRIHGAANGVTAPMVLRASASTRTRRRPRATGSVPCRSGDAIPSRTVPGSRQDSPVASHRATPAPVPAAIALGHRDRRVVHLADVSGADALDGARGRRNTARRPAVRGRRAGVHVVPAPALRQDPRPSVDKLRRRLRAGPLLPDAHVAFV